ncbi:aminoglycoside 3'-phosphotransferase [Mycolicibacterium sp. 018/SC-01/001]|uniref:aminoglycoside 3'-phosphotransferase n=1 Tax=Mycolicibacterium sp. 018/SC-01/001 TaxID=2592069 RepID=UPI00117FB2E6|nr:aminoglycoside 3'-phosphotransferase [Mycolicibacterium sp. 018/SC-01/001]TRW88900.1 aminoglycoside 3'-phosphotransferase [Mycolicibacterium sp. 018/SC-01/001]
MSTPSQPPPVPAVVSEIADGRSVTAVWVNELGGVTFAVGGPPPVEFVKTHPDPNARLLDDEAKRLRWARRYATVPEVLATGPGWLHTAALAGRSAVDAAWTARPRDAARAIGAGLRALHDALPVTDCPFGPPSWIGCAPPQPDRLVVCHGDACAPNTLMADDGSFAGHVDLGDLGVADRWADLAIATMSLDWNYAGGDWQDLLLDTYGVRPDVERIAFYRRRWDDEPSAPG